MILRKIVYPFFCLMLCSCNFQGQNTTRISDEMDDRKVSIVYDEPLQKRVEYANTKYDVLNEQVNKYLQDVQKQMKDISIHPKQSSFTSRLIVNDGNPYFSILVKSFYDDTSERIKTFTYDKKKKAMVTLHEVLSKKQKHLVLKDMKEHLLKNIDIQWKKQPYFLYHNNLTLYIRNDKNEVMEYRCSYDALNFAQQDQKQVHPTLEEQTILFEDDVYIDPTKPMVCFTFDDGPHPINTDKILDILKRNHAHATFFVLGCNVDRAPNALKRMVLEGHQIGNHTYDHLQLTILSSSQITEQIEKTQEKIYSYTHQYPTHLRPPYGAKNERVYECAKDLNVYTWTLDTLDWKSRDAQTIVTLVMNTIKSQDIVLFHDLYPSTVEAISILVPALREKGYQFVTIQEMEEVMK